MEESIKLKLKKGFTAARWGIDICLGALFIAIALLISALKNKDMDLLKVLMVPFAMCIAGIMVFAAGRIMAGLQSRQLSLHRDRPLTEEEKWFVSSMLEVESKGAGVNFYNTLAKNTTGSADDAAAGAMASAIIGKFFEVGKKYMGQSILFNRLPAIVSLVAAAVIIIIAVI